MKTNDEWKAIIQEVSAALDSSQPQPAISAQSLTPSTLGKTIDHTLLKLDATPTQVTATCNEAIKYNFAAVCVRLPFVPHALSQLTAAASESAIAVACTVGFHEGTYPTAAKVAEAEQAIAAGSREFDVVLNRDVLLAGDLEGVFAELSALRKVAPATVVIKLILETSQLARGDIVAASVLAGYAGFDFIKTSTGFVGGGATVENVALMSKIADVLSKRDDLGEFKGKRMKVKASGGVRSLGEARAMIEAGAERIGTSGGVGIMKEFLGEEQSGVGGSGGY